jgi:hypothetical protein
VLALLRELHIALLAAVAAAQTVGKNSQATVLKLLTDTAATIKSEMATGESDHKAFLELSRSTIQETEHNIDRNNDKVAEFTAIGQKANSQVAADTASLADLSAKTAQDEKDLADAQALRKQQNKDFKAGQQELEDTIDTLVRAASILRRAGLGGGPAEQAALVQVTKVLSVVMDAAVINSADKAKLSALLQSASGEDEEGFDQPTAAAYKSHSGSIIDTLQELKEKAEGELSDLRKDEMNRQHEFDLLQQSLQDSISTQNRDHKAATSSKAENEEIAAKAAGDLAAEQKDLSQNKQFLADSQNDRENKKNDYAATTKSQNEELAAIAKAEQILRQTFADAGASAAAAKSVRSSFVQVATADDDARAQVVTLLRKAAHQYASVALQQLATRAQDDTFGKVKGLIRDMIARLQKQAAAEAEKNAWCNEQKAENVAKRDDQQGKFDNFSTRLEKGTADEAMLKDDVATLSGQVADLDSFVSSSTALRNKESTAYAHDAEAYRITLQGLQGAITTLREYYSTAGAASHSKKTDGNNGIVSMLEVFEQDMANSQAQAEMAENNAIKAFKKSMQDSAVDKATKEASIKSKQGELARLAQLLRDLQNDVEGSKAELDATLAYLAKLKADCTHKPQSFADRAAAMQKEIASLKQALQILDSETSFLQRF